MLKKILAIFIIMILFCGCTNKNDNNNLIKQIFGISKDLYTVVDEKNTLKNDDYGGRYYATIKIEQNKMDEFLKYIKKEYNYVEYSDEYNEYFTRLTGEQLEKQDKIYVKVDTSDRIKGDGILKSAYSYIVYSESNENCYLVKLYYSES